MKFKSTIKVLSAIIALVFFTFKAGATIHIVTVSNFQFSPATIPNVVVGDIIEWDWQAGSFNHTTTCDPATQSGTSLPAGAATWNSTLNAGNPTFQYTVTVAGVYNYWCNFHSPGMAASFTASAALPVKLSEFKISSQNSNAVLSWTTASEENVDYFSVQKSKTGSDFIEITRVKATGHSSIVTSYTYTDLTSSSPDKYFYYTIAAVDKDGKKEFSSVALFKNKISAAKIILSLSPNPISRAGHLMMKFNADRTGKMNVRLTSMEGKTIMETTMQAYEGVNNGHLMLGDLAAGSYSISFELDGIKEVHTLLVK